MKIFASLKKALTAIGVIIVCALFILSCISTSKRFDATGLSYEGYSNDGTTMIVMFKNGMKQVLAFDKEMRIIELWQMKCSIIKWDWYGLWFYVKPNNNPDLNDSQYGENPIGFLLRLRFRGIHDTPTTIYNTVEAGSCMSGAYYYGMKKNEEFTESATFMKDGGLDLNDSKLRPTQMDTKTFNELWESIERTFKQNKFSEIIGKKLPFAKLNASLQR